MQKLVFNTLAILKHKLFIKKPGKINIFHK